MSEQELMTLPSERTQLEEFFIQPDVKDLAEVTATIRTLAADLPADMAVKKNRDAVASFAYRVARLKTTVDKTGAELKAEYVDIPKKIDATRKQYKDAFEALQAEIRKPVTDWEEAEKERVMRLERMLDKLQNWDDQIATLSTEDIRKRISETETLTVGYDWQEFRAEAQHQGEKALAGLREALTAAEQREDEQAELERLRKEAEERAQKDREEAIAREAAEKAKQDQAAALAKAQADAELAEQRRIAAEKQAEQDRADAERKAAEAAAQAAAQERQRIEAEQARADAERKAREADREHQGKINSAAMAALQQAGQLSDAQAKAVIVAIIKGCVPNVTINY